MYQIENLNEDKFTDVAKVLKEKSFDLDHVIIAAKDTTVKMPKHLLLLTSPFIRDILVNYPPSIDPFFIIPDDGFKSEAVEKVCEILLDSESKSCIKNDEMRLDIDAFLELMNIDKTLFVGTNETRDQDVEADDLDVLIKEEGEDECLMKAIDEMEQLLESEITPTEVKEEVLNETSEIIKYAEDKKYECSDCEKKFNNRSSVSRHKRRVHKNENIKQETTQGPTQYTTESVDDTATETEKVIGDMDETKAVADPKKETKEVVNPILCQICRNLSTDLGDLWNHYKGTHFSKPAVKFHTDISTGLVCKKCKNSFDEENYLFMHMGVCHSFL